MSEPDRPFTNFDEAQEAHHAKLKALADAMTKPERPRCGTCPYGTEVLDNEQIGPWVRCGLHPAVFVGVLPDDPVSNSEAVGDYPWVWSQPIMAGDASCSSHPDFPAYIAARKASDQLTSS
jgi:hypothetical protein